MAITDTYYTCYYLYYIQLIHVESETQLVLNKTQILRAQCRKKIMQIFSAPQKTWTLISICVMFKHFSSSYLALSIFQFPCAHYFPTCLTPIPRGSQWHHLNCHSKTPQWPQPNNPNASIQIKLLKLLCQPSRRHQWFDPEDTQHDKLHSPFPHPGDLSFPSLNAWCILLLHCIVYTVMICSGVNWGYIWQFITYI